MLYSLLKSGVYCAASLPTEVQSIWTSPVSAGRVGSGLVSSETVEYGVKATQSSSSMTRGRTSEQPAVSHRHAIK